MLGFLTTDAAVSPEMLQCAVKEAADVSFNMVSVDGDTSTNDTLAVLASGKAGNQEITEKSEDYQAFLEGWYLYAGKSPSCWPATEKERPSC